MNRRKPLEEGTDAHYRDGEDYDHMYRRRRADVRFYADLAENAGGPVLELGIGTGRVARAIAERGVDVVGVDRMAPMLEQARERLAQAPTHVRDRVVLHRGDLRTLRLGRRFPLVISPFNVFMHLYTRPDLERAFATVHAHLAPRGRFAFDVLLPDVDALALDPDRIYRLGTFTSPSLGRVSHRERFRYDPIAQIQTIEFIEQPVERPGRARVTPLTHRQFFPAELEALLHYNGFAIEALYGDFEGQPLDDLSESQVFVARPRVTRARGRRSNT